MMPTDHSMGVGVFRKQPIEPCHKGSLVINREQEAAERGKRMMLRLVLQSMIEQGVEDIMSE